MLRRTFFYVQDRLGLPDVQEQCLSVCIDGPPVRAAGPLTLPQRPGEGLTGATGDQELATLNQALEEAADLPTA